MLEKNYNLFEKKSKFLRPVCGEIPLTIGKGVAPSFSCRRDVGTSSVDGTSQVRIPQRVGKTVWGLPRGGGTSTGQEGQRRSGKVIAALLEDIRGGFFYVRPQRLLALQPTPREGGAAFAGAHTRRFQDSDAAREREAELALDATPLSSV